MFRVLFRPRRAHQTGRRMSWGLGFIGARWKTVRGSLLPFEFAVTRPIQRPFFTALHDLLDRHPVLTMETLLQEAGEQVWGLTVLLLAMLTFIPGVANIVSLATLIVGVGMMRRSARPWLPAKMLQLEFHRGRIKDLLAKVESRLAWIASRDRVRRAPSQRFVGFLVAWSAFLALLPIPLPFANVLPAMALILLGVALLEEWPSLGWYGALTTFGTTIYFAFSIRQILHLLRGLRHWIMHGLGPGML